MNRKILSLTVLFITLFIGVCRADDIPIYFRDDPRTTKSETPVTGDYNDDSGELALKFSESEVYDVAVISEKGVVYSAKVTIKTYGEVRLNVREYEGEAYTVVVTDSKGRVYEGDFFA